MVPALVARRLQRCAVCEEGRCLLSSRIRWHKNMPLLLKELGRVQSLHDCLA